MSESRLSLDDQVSHDPGHYQGDTENPHLPPPQYGVSSGQGQRDPSLRSENLFEDTSPEPVATSATFAGALINDPLDFRPNLLGVSLSRPECRSTIMSSSGVGPQITISPNMPNFPLDHSPLIQHDPYLNPVPSQDTNFLIQALNNMLRDQKQELAPAGDRTTTTKSTAGAPTSATGDRAQDTTAAARDRAATQLF